MGIIIKIKVNKRMAQNRIYAGMPDADYEKECKLLYAENDENSDGVLVLDEFKEFTINCAKAAGVSETDLEGMKSEGSDSMWSMMFRQFDRTTTDPSRGKRPGPSSRRTDREKKFTRRVELDTD